MTTPTRIYTVSDGNTDRLVRAAHRSQALMHVARDVYKSRVATQDDLVLALSAGVQIEDVRPTVGDDETSI